MRPAPFTASIISGGRRTQSVGHESRPLSQSNIDLRSCCVGREGCRAGAIHTTRKCPVIGGHFGNLVASQDVVYEFAVFGWNHLDEVRRGETAGVVAGVTGRDDQVDAVRLVANRVLYPLKVDFKCFGGVADRSQNSHPSSFRNRCYHVSAMAEREYRELQIEHSRYVVTHNWILLLAQSLS